MMVANSFFRVAKRSSSKMIRALAAALALAVPLLSSAAQAKKVIIHPHFSDRRYGPSPRSYDGNEPAEAYSNCLPWSPKLQNWVWICGPPYPPNYPAIR